MIPSANSHSAPPPEGGNVATARSRRSVLLQWILVLILVAATVAVYAPVRGFPFITMDDPEYVDNPHVRAGLTAEGVKWAFTTFYFANWHPLTWISHMMDAAWFGSDPTGHHLVSLLLHVLNGVLLFLALAGMTGDPWKSGFVAFLFALHPLHVESVAWVAERKDVLFAFFLFLALPAYARYARRPGFRTYAPLFLLYAFALMSKPMAVTFPFLLLLLDWWPLGRLRESGGPPAALGGFVPASPAKLLVEKIPLLFLSAGSSVITFMAQATTDAVAGYGMLPAGVRIANVAVSYLRYVGHSVWPFRLSFYYPHPGSSLGWVPAAVSAAAVVAASLFALSHARRNPPVFAGWFWYLGTLVPVIGFVQVGAQSMADRYTYVPLIGLFIAAAWGIPRLLPERQWRVKVLAALSIAVLAAAAWQSRVQLGYWRSSMSLYCRALEVTSDNYLMHNNIGVLHEEQGNLDDAIREYGESVRISPIFAIARRNLGMALKRKGNFREAMPHLREAVRLNPGFTDAKLALGVALHQTGNFPEAIRIYEDLLAANPANIEAARLLWNARQAGGGG